MRFFVLSVLMFVFTSCEEYVPPVREVKKIDHICKWTEWELKQGKTSGDILFSGHTYDYSVRMCTVCGKTETKD